MEKLLKISCMLFFFWILSSSEVSAEATNTSSKPLVESACGQLNANCEVCTDNSDCFWCDSSKTCSSYSIIPKGCSKAQWFVRQCTIAGFWLIIVVPCVAVFLLVCLICCCWCCCCRKNKSKAEEKYKLQDSRRKQEQDKRRSYHEERNSERQIERDRIREKYGLYNTQSSAGGYQRMDNN